MYPPRSFDRVYSKHINALKGGRNSDKRVCERLRLFGFLWSLTLSTPHKQPQSNILCQYKLICNLYPVTIGLALHVSSVTVFLCFCGSLVCTITATPMKNRECDVLPRSTRCHYILKPRLHSSTTAVNKFHTKRVTTPKQSISPATTP